MPHRITEAMGGIHKPTADAPPEEQIARWQKLFNYSRTEAIEQIQDHKNHALQEGVPNSEWELVKLSRIPLGYDREAYEHEMFLKQGHERHGRHDSGHDVPTDGTVQTPGTPDYALKLDGPLGTVCKVQAIANLPKTPKIQQGRDHFGGSTFCVVDSETKKTVESWLAEHKPLFKPSFEEVDG